MSNITDLVSMRQWLIQIADSVPVEDSRKAHDRINQINDYLWRKCFTEGRSPWDTGAKYSTINSTIITDPNFEDTVQKLKEGKLDVPRRSESDGYKNS